MTEAEELWVRIITIHNYTKGLFTQAEELDEEFKTFLQPGNELKNALEHIIRAQATKYAINSSKEHDSFLKDLKRAEGHECRAFFDTADWFSISLRKSIFDLLSPFSKETIKTVYEKYYSEDRLKIDEICNSIASYREKKSICNETELIEIVDHYMIDISQLHGLLTKIKKMECALIEFESKKSKEKFSSVLINISIGLACAFAGAIAAWLLTKA